MKKITRSFILKTVAFILCVVCFGTAAYIVFSNILTSSGVYKLEETAEDALSYELWKSLNMIRGEVITYNRMKNTGSAAPEVTEVQDGDIPEEVQSEPEPDTKPAELPAYPEKILSFIDSRLDKDKFEYYIYIGGEYISNGSENTADYTGASIYYVLENGYQRYSMKNFSPPFSEADYPDDFSGYRILIKFNPDYVNEFRDTWFTEKTALESSVPKALMFIIAAIVCIVYLLWVCGKNAADDEVHLLLVDRMYVEISLSLICAAALGASLCIAFIADDFFSYDRTLISAYLHALTALVSAAAAIITALMMSLMRNLKNRSFLKHSLIVCLTLLCFRLLKICLKYAKILLKVSFKYAKILLVKMFVMIRFICERAVKLLRLLFVWVFKTASNMYRSAKDILMRAVGGRDKKIGRIIAFGMCVYSAVLIILSYYAVLYDEIFMIIQIGFVVFGVYHLLKKLADADRIKEGIMQLRNGKSDFKIDNISGSMFKDTAEAINSIGEGIKLSVERGVKAERMKSELITNVSHDLKTPLTSIINYSELLCSEKLEPAEANDYVKIIRSKAESLKRLTSDLFDISKVQSGNETINIEHIDIGLLINQTLAEQEESIKNSGLDFDVNISDNVYADADGKKLSRVFENLIINAVKYSMKGTRVYITAENKGASIIEIKNIASYKMNFNEDEITERFVRGDISRSTEGSGLGLAIAKSYTEACGGQFNITVDGDLFKVRIIF